MQHAAFLCQIILILLLILKKPREVHPLNCINLRPKVISITFIHSLCLSASECAIRLSTASEMCLNIPSPLHFSARLPLTEVDEVQQYSRATHCIVPEPG